MRSLLFTVALLLVQSALAADIIGTVGTVKDGDTLWICDQADCTQIRLCGVNSPELWESGGPAAHDALAKIVAGHIVRCIPVGDGTVCDGRSDRTNRGRIVAQCFVGTTDVAVEMVRLGQACDWARYSGGYYGKIPGACSK